MLASASPHWSGSELAAKARNTANSVARFATVKPISMRGWKVA